MHSLAESQHRPESVRPPWLLPRSQPSTKSPTSDLSGLIIGQTLRTTAPEVFRALVEASAFGARRIIDNFEAHGVPITDVRCAGGLINSAAIMQLYADALGRPLSVAGVAQAGAQRSAIHAAIAAGEYPDLVAAAAMGRERPDAYRPDSDRAVRYDQLYAEYSELYQLFGKGSEVLHRLRATSRDARTGATSGVASLRSWVRQGMRIGPDSAEPARGGDLGRLLFAVRVEDARDVIVRTRKDPRIPCGILGSGGYLKTSSLLNFSASR